jgi:hypothetical protein
MSSYGCMYLIPKSLYNTYLTQGDRTVREAASSINIRQLNNISNGQKTTIQNNDNFKGVGGRGGGGGGRGSFSEPPINISPEDSNIPPRENDLEEEFVSPRSSRNFGQTSAQVTDNFGQIRNGQTGETREAAVQTEQNTTLDTLSGPVLGNKPNLLEPTRSVVQPQENRDVGWEDNTPELLDRIKRLQEQDLDGRSIETQTDIHPPPAVWDFNSHRTTVDEPMEIDTTADQSTQVERDHLSRFATSEGTQTENVVGASVETQANIPPARASVETQANILPARASVITQANILPERASVETQANIPPARASVETQTNIPPERANASTQVEGGDPRFATAQSTQTENVAATNAAPPTHAIMNIHEPPASWDWQSRRGAKRARTNEGSRDTNFPPPDVANRSTQTQTAAVPRGRNLTTTAVTQNNISPGPSGVVRRLSFSSPESSDLESRRNNDRDVNLFRSAFARNLADNFREAGRSATPVQKKSVETQANISPPPPARASVETQANIPPPKKVLTFSDPTSMHITPQKKKSVETQAHISPPPPVRASVETQANIPPPKKVLTFSDPTSMHIAPQKKKSVETQAHISPPPPARASVETQANIPPPKKVLTFSDPTSMHIAPQKKKSVETQAHIFPDRNDANVGTTPPKKKVLSFSGPTSMHVKPQKKKSVETQAHISPARASVETQAHISPDRNDASVGTTPQKKKVLSFSGPTSMHVKPQKKKSVETQAHISPARASVETQAHFSPPPPPIRVDAGVGTTPSPARAPSTGRSVITPNLPRTPSSAGRGVTPVGSPWTPPSAARNVTPQSHSPRWNFQGIQPLDDNDVQEQPVQNVQAVRGIPPNRPGFWRRYIPVRLRQPGGAAYEFHPMTPPGARGKRTIKRLSKYSPSPFQKTRKAKKNGQQVLRNENNGQQEEPVLEESFQPLDDDDVQMPQLRSPGKRNPKRPIPYSPSPFQRIRKPKKVREDELNESFQPPLGKGKKRSAAIAATVIPIANTKKNGKRIIVKPKWQGKGKSKRRKIELEVVDDNYVNRKTKKDYYI